MRAYAGPNSTPRARRSPLAIPRVGDLLWTNDDAAGVRHRAGRCSRRPGRRRAAPPIPKARLRARCCWLLLVALLLHHQLMIDAVEGFGAVRCSGDSSSAAC